MAVRKVYLCDECGEEIRNHAEAREHATGRPRGSARWKTLHYHGACCPKPTCGDEETVA